MRCSSACRLPALWLPGRSISVIVALALNTERFDFFLPLLRNKLIDDTCHRQVFTWLHECWPRGDEYALHFAPANPY